jgi:hypothetical protein
MRKCWAVLERLRGRYLAPVIARAARRHRDVLRARHFGRRLSPCESDQILIGPVGLWRSHEVFLVDSVCHQGPPRRAKSTVTSLGDVTRKLDGPSDQEGEG